MSYQGVRVDVQRAVDDAIAADSSGVVDAAVAVFSGDGSTTAGQVAMARAAFGAVGSVFGPVGALLGQQFGAWFAKVVPPATGTGIYVGYGLIAAAIDKTNRAGFARAGIATDRQARAAWAAAANAVAGQLNGSQAFFGESWGGKTLATPYIGAVAMVDPASNALAGWATWAHNSKHTRPRHDLQSLATRLTRASLAAWAALGEQGVSLSRPVLHVPDAPGSASGGDGAGPLVVALLAWLL